MEWKSAPEKESRLLRMGQGIASLQGRPWSVTCRPRQMQNALTSDITGFDMEQRPWKIKLALCKLALILSEASFHDLGADRDISLPPEGWVLRRRAPLEHVMPRPRDAVRTSIS